jgi:hypothetical protein
VNAESPAYAWPDAVLDGVELNDEKQLQMFETHVSSNPEIRAYNCHIAPKGKYPEYEDDPDNFVYGSGDFHNYFDGLKVKPKGIPPMLIRPQKSYVARCQWPHVQAAEDRRAHRLHEPSRMQRDL